VQRCQRAEGRMDGMDTVKTCPQCGSPAGAATLKCRNCGAFLVSAPPPPQPVSAPAAAPVAPRDDEQFFAAATFTPVAVMTPPPAKRAFPTGRVLAAALVLAAGIALYTTFAHAGHSSSKAPVVLPSTSNDGGLPNLEQAVRVQSEATRQQALSAVAQAVHDSDGAPLDTATLARIQPSFHWYPANESSTGPHDVSFVQTDQAVTVAVSTSSRQVCVFGRLNADNTEEYVTLGNVTTCRATDAPPHGWTHDAGQGGERSGVVPGS
jgi:hypothetical protein